MQPSTVSCDHSCIYNSRIPAHDSCSVSRVACGGWRAGSVYRAVRCRWVCGVGPTDTHNHAHRVTENAQTHIKRMWGMVHASCARSLRTHPPPHAGKTEHPFPDHESTLPGGMLHGDERELRQTQTLIQSVNSGANSRIELWSTVDACLPFAGRPDSANAERCKAAARLFRWLAAVQLPAEFTGRARG